MLRTFIHKFILIIISHRHVMLSLNINGKKMKTWAKYDRFVTRQSITYWIYVGETYMCMCE